MRGTICAFLGMLALAGTARAEIYGYSISASVIDPYENQAAPVLGLLELYVWLDCADDTTDAGGMVLTGSLTDRFLGVEGIVPVVVVQGDNLALGWAGPGVLGPTPLFKLLFFDPTGAGGNLCLTGENDPYPSGCFEGPGGVLFCDAAAVHGFSSDGTTPCVLGNCFGPVSIDDASWGRVKVLYR